MAVIRIAVVAPSCPLKREAADRVRAMVAERGDCELLIHDQCFLTDGHFAGSDEARLGALREVMADRAVDAVWFARGGYGSNRIAEETLALSVESGPELRLERRGFAAHQPVQRPRHRRLAPRAKDVLRHRTPGDIQS